MAARKKEPPPPPVTSVREAIASLKAQGIDAKLVWAANQQGDRYGNVPPDWDAPFREGSNGQ